MKKILFLFFGFIAYQSDAQYHDLRLPRVSPAASVSRTIGLTTISIEYSSPKAGDREIWGNIVSFDSDVPWRAGANEVTTFDFNTDVQIEGELLKAGRYGFLVVPSETGKWTLIFSKNSSYWGGYYYDKKDDALKLEVTPTACAFVDELAYSFSNSTTNSVTVMLAWARKAIPFQIEVNTIENTIASLRNELTGNKGNNWYAWVAAARYCLRNKTNLDEAVTWVDRAMAGGYGGYQATTNFMTLFTKFQLLQQLGRASEAIAIQKEALKNLTTAEDYSMYASAEGAANPAKGIDIYRTAIQKFPNKYMLQLNIADLYLKMNDKKRALDHKKAALPMTPLAYKQELQNEIDALSATIGQ